MAYVKLKSIKEIKIYIDEVLFTDSHQVASSIWSLQHQEKDLRQKTREWMTLQSQFFKFETLL